MDTILKISYFKKRGILMARIRVNGTIKDKSTGIRTYGEVFDFKSKRFHKKSPNAIVNNRTLSQFEADVYESVVTGRPISRANTQEVTLMSAIDEYMSMAESGALTSRRSNAPLSLATKRNIKTVLTFVKGLGVDFNFSQVNASTYGAKSHYQSFIGRLKSAMTEKGLENSTLWARLALLKTVIKTVCERHDIELGNLLNGMVIKLIQKDVVVISHPQVEYMIRNYDSILSSCKDGEKVALDYWITALILNPRKTDMMSFEKDNLHDVDGKMWIRYRPNKTKNSSSVVVNVPVPDVLVPIFKRNLEKYGRPLAPCADHYRIPEKIREIAKRIGIFDQPVQIFEKGKYLTVPQWQTLTLHQMRASGVTDKLGMGMPEALVKAYSGHTADSRSFRRYVNIHDEAKEKFSSMYFSAISSGESSAPPQKEASLG